MTRSTTLQLTFALGLASMAAGCDAAEPAPASGPTALSQSSLELHGVYRPVAAGPIALFEVEADGRYWLWWTARVTGCGAMVADPYACAESGTYTVDGDSLMLTDGETGERSRLGVALVPANAEDVRPRDLLVGTSQLISGTVRLIFGDGSSEDLSRYDVALMGTCGAVNTAGAIVVVDIPCGGSYDCGGGRAASSIGQGFCS